MYNHIQYLLCSHIVSFLNGVNVQHSAVFLISPRLFSLP